MLSIQEYVNEELNNYNSETENFTFIVSDDNFFHKYKNGEYTWYDCVKIMDNDTKDILYYIWSDEVIFLEDISKHFLDYPATSYMRLNLRYIPDWCTKAYEFYNNYKNKDMYK